MSRPRKNATEPRTPQQRWKNTYYLKNKNRLNELVKRRSHELKALVLSHYGGGCAVCGEKREVVLDIDHIEGGGNKHRKEVIKSFTIHRYLYRNNYPKGFRILCRNCNWIAYIESLKNPLDKFPK